MSKLIISKSLLSPRLSRLSWCNILLVLRPRKAHESIVWRLAIVWLPLTPVFSVKTTVIASVIIIAIIIAIKSIPATAAAAVII